MFNFGGPFIEKNAKAFMCCFWHAKSIIKTSFRFRLNAIRYILLSKGGNKCIINLSDWLTHKWGYVEKWIQNSAFHEKRKQHPHNETCLNLPWHLHSCRSKRSAAYWTQRIKNAIWIVSCIIISASSVNPIRESTEGYDH